MLKALGKIFYKISLQKNEKRNKEILYLYSVVEPFSCDLLKSQVHEVTDNSPDNGQGHLGERLAGSVGSQPMGYKQVFAFFGKRPT